MCEKLGVRSVTLEGDLYDPKGTLTGGSRPKGNSSVLIKMGECKAKAADLAHLEAQLKGVRARLDGCAAAKAAKDAIELKEHALALKQKEVGASEAGTAAANVASLQAEAAAAAEAKAAAEAAAKAAKADEKRLSAELKDSEGNADERLAKAKKALGAAEKERKAAAKKAATARQAEQKGALAIDAKAKEGEEAASQRAELSAAVAAAAQELHAQKKSVVACKQAHDAAAANLQARHDELAEFDTGLQAVRERREAAEAEEEKARLALKKAELDGDKVRKEGAAVAADVKELLAKQPWLLEKEGELGAKVRNSGAIRRNSAQFSDGPPILPQGGEFDFKARKPSAVEKELHRLAAELDRLSKRINKKVLAMCEKAEGEYKELMEKKTIVLADKAKIEAVISELEAKKVEALQQTYEKVNKDFGGIFGSLLGGGAKARLSTVEGQPIDEGLVINVGFGDVWKKNLTELSGGQKSLVALSLVLALLKFKPAPLYILDEVDAALDLSHTQNIGTMIATHFKQSQFLVVSLKQGMFNNANCLFTTKLVDGSSTVTRSVPAAAAAKAAAPKGKAAAAVGRNALAAVN